MTFLLSNGIALLWNLLFGSCVDIEWAPIQSNMLPLSGNFGASADLVSLVGEGSFLPTHPC